MALARSVKIQRPSSTTPESTTRQTTDVSSESVPMKTPATSTTTRAAILPRRLRARSSGMAAAQASTGAMVCDTEAAGQ